MLRIAILIAALAPAAASAQAGVQGDAEAGQSKAGVCAACHGMDGNSQVPQWPKLAGQHEDYLARQTRLVRDRQRDVPQMYPIVMNLTDQDIADISAWFASQTIKPGVADEALVEAGRSLYHGGNHDSGVPACMACHGPAGYGIPGTGFPMVRAQHATYLADRLRRYRNGETNGPNDPYSKIMVAVAQELTDAEIEAVSSYMEGLHAAE
ncbi:MAG: c-type cytochrome [Wenzhouxiangellaceae bacterium]|nr:c-type cytochrome [Wenzhouxiangellaceae bacterium]